MRFLVCVLFVVALWAQEYSCPVCKKIIKLDKDGKVYDVSSGKTNIINTNVAPLLFVGANLIEGRKTGVMGHVTCNTNETFFKSVFVSATNYKLTNIIVSSVKEIK